MSRINSVRFLQFLTFFTFEIMIYNVGFVISLKTCHAHRLQFIFRPIKLSPKVTHLIEIFYVNHQVIY